MGWMDDARAAVAKALSAAFDLDPESEAALKRFVPAYLEPATNTQAPRNVDLCYYAISTSQGTDMDYIQTRVEEVNGATVGVLGKTIPVDVLLTFYGPHADDDSEHCWSAFLWDFGPASPRAVLRGLRFSLRGRPERPVSLYETEGTYQRRRCDVRLQLQYLYEERHAVGTVERAPEITITNQ